MDFLDYYRENLGYLRTLGAEFAAEFPKIAARLDLSSFECQPNLRVQVIALLRIVRIRYALYPGL